MIKDPQGVSSDGCQNVASVPVPCPKSPPETRIAHNPTRPAMAKTAPSDTTTASRAGLCKLRSVPWRAGIRRAFHGRKSTPGREAANGGLNAAEGNRTDSYIGNREGVTTIEMIIQRCGRSLIEPSAVSAPMDYLTSEVEYRCVWQVLKTWLCSAVSAKLRASFPKFFSLSYRAFNLGICIPTLELDARFLQRYRISQEQSLSSKSAPTPQAPQQVTFSRDALGKGSGLPAVRAAYALEALLCTIGKEAGLGSTLLIDCGVGVLAARGRVVKFTFVQGADSLAVVRQPAALTAGSWRAAGKGTGADRGGIHAFGQCYIPYTSRENKELAQARSRETSTLLRALRDARRERGGRPAGVGGEEDMADKELVRRIREWTPGVKSVLMAASQGARFLASADDDDSTEAISSSPVICRQRRGGRWLFGRRRVDRDGQASLPPPSAATTMPPLIDVHARLRASLLSASPSPSKRGTGAESPRQGHDSVRGLEPRGVERIGSHYSPAAQTLLLDVRHGCIRWRRGWRQWRQQPGGVGNGTAERPHSPTVLRVTRGKVTPRSAPNEWRAALAAEASEGAGPAYSACDSGRAPKPDVRRQWPNAVARETAEEAATAVRNAEPSKEDDCRYPKEADADTPFECGVGNDLDSGLRNGNGDRNSPIGAAPSHPDVFIELGPATNVLQLARVSWAPAPPLRMGGQYDEHTSHGRMQSAPSPAIRTSGGANVGIAMSNVDAGSETPHQQRYVSGVDGAACTDTVETAGIETFRRYSHYVERDEALADNVAALQPSWQAGIVRKFLAGLGRRSRDAVESSLPDDDCYDEEGSDSSDDVPAGRHGGVNGRGTGAETAGGATGSADGLEEEDVDEDGDHFEVNQAPAALRTGSLAVMTRQTQAATMECGAGNRPDAGERFLPPSTRTEDQFTARTPRSETFDDGGLPGSRKRRSSVAHEGGHAGAPEALQEGLARCLGEACEAFQRSIRRAVVNYVLLDAGQRQRVGIHEVPPGFSSEGWGWGMGRGFHESPPEWRTRFCRAKRALEAGHIAASPALLAARALLVECREIRLLKLPRSTAAVWSSRRFPMTAEEFRSSQLKHLAKTTRRVQQLLYPGLSDALTSHLGGENGAVWTPRHDSHIRRYLGAVNVLTASVLRGMVETALGDLLAFFEMYRVDAEGKNNDTRWHGRSVSEVDGEHGEAGVQQARGVGGDDAADAQLEGGAAYEKRHQRHSRETNPICRPAFKVFLEEHVPDDPDTAPNLACARSLRKLKAAVAEVLRAVVLSFDAVPRVAYEHADPAEHAPSAKRWQSHDPHPDGVSGGAGGDTKRGGHGDHGDGEAGQRLSGDGRSGAAGSQLELANTMASTPAQPHQRPEQRLSLYSEPESGSEFEDVGGRSDASDSASDASRSVVVPLFRKEDTSSARLNQIGTGAMLVVLPPDEPIVTSTTKAIFHYLRSSSSTARSACVLYRPFRGLLHEAVEAKTLPTDAAADDLPRLAESLRRYRATAAVLREGSDAAPLEVAGALVVVDCEGTSRRLLALADDLTKGALQWVVMTLGRIAGDVTKQARTAILRLGKRPRSTNEMAEAIEYLRITQAQEQAELRKRQACMGQLLDFVFEHGAVSHETAASVAGVHRVMAELATATHKAAKAIAEGQAQLRKGVEKARRRVEDDVESAQARMEGFFDGIGRPRDIADKMTSFMEQLEGLKTQATELAEEEVKLDGFSSGSLVALTDKVLASFAPYADVWTIVAAVGPFCTSTLRSPVTSLDPEAIEKEHTSIKGRLEQLHQFMTSKSHMGPARAAQDALRQLAVLEKDIPVMRALSNPRLKDRHWKKLSALAGVTVSSDHPPTLQQLNELDVLTEAKVEAIVRLSDTADAEQALANETAPVDVFIRGEAVLRVVVGERKAWGNDDEDATVPVSRVDEKHLEAVLEKVKKFRVLMAGVKETAAAVSTPAGSSEAGAGPNIVEALELALAALERAGQAFLKCCGLVTEIESEIEEQVEDDIEPEEGLKTLVERWQAVLDAQNGRSLKDLADIAEAALAELEEVS